MLSAAEARVLMPQLDLERILAEIDTLVREAASSGKGTVDVARVIRNVPMDNWSYARKSAAQAQIFKALKDLGYEVKAHDGGHSGGATYYVTWGP